ncbi:MAG: glycosyltransferase, partial [Planctomycetota bacterium]|jgi:glycosyltransferase involved in cell wall biosynthesis
VALNGPATPKALLREAIPSRYHTALRRLYRFGLSRYCPVCDSRLRRFVPYGTPPRGEAMCPVCGSMARHRLTWLYLKRETDLLGPARKRMLHFAPEPGIAARLARLSRLDYVTADIASPLAGVRVDITNMGFADCAFDVAYCGHVLEHVADDRRAACELFRVLRPGGWAVITVPVSGETTFEAPTARTSEERLRAFGHPDHYRRYGRDLAGRLEKAGFVVSVEDYGREFSPWHRRRMGLRAGQSIFFCRKAPAAAPAVGEGPLVSVVVPVWNAERYVEQAVRSALEQSCRVEVILVEDASNDASLSVCRRLAARSDRVRLFRHPGGSNRGAGASRNLGIRQAQGKYVAFLDADDYYLPGRFDADMVMMEADAALAGVYGAVANVFETGHATMSGGDQPLTTLTGRVPPARLLASLLLKSQGSIHTNGITVRRRVFEATGLFDEHLVLSQDTAMWLKMAAACRLVPGSIVEPVAVRRRHPANRSSPANPFWHKAACASLWSVLCWAHAGGQASHKIALLRRFLALAIVDRRGATGLVRVGRTLSRIARYGVAYPPVLFDLLLLAARKGMRLPLVGEPEVGRRAGETQDQRPRPAQPQEGRRPLVSVVMPAYNAQRYVEEAVESALALPLDLEVVIVEDGSADETLSVCRRLAAESDRVRLFRHPGGANRGAGASRNAGVRNSRGEYIAFLDADDYYLPGRFDADVAILEANPAVDGVYGAVASRFEDGSAPMPGGETGLTTMTRRVAPDELPGARLLESSGWFCTPGITVRRRVFEATGLFDEHLVLSQDTAMWLKMAAACRLVPGSIAEPIAVRRRHAANRSRLDSPHWDMAACHCIRAVLRWASRKRLPARRLRQLRKGLALAVVDRRGRQGLSRAWRIVRRALVCGQAYLPVVPEVALLAVTKLLGRPIVECPRGAEPSCEEGSDQ